MDVLVTRYIGIRGTAILAREYRDDLVNRYPKWLIDEACQFDSYLNNSDSHSSDFHMSDSDIFDSCIHNIENGFEDENIIYCKEYTEFGIFEALFQMSRELKCGLEINIKDIPIKQETVEICEFTGVNPYALYAGYSSVVVAKDGKKAVEFYEKNGIPATIVGTTTEDNDKIVINEDERGFLPHIRKDELKTKLGRRLYYERTDSISAGEEQQN